jgi:hypothetical protein
VMDRISRIGISARKALVLRSDCRDRTRVGHTASDSRGRGGLHDIEAIENLFRYQVEPVRPVVEAKATSHVRVR